MKIQSWILTAAVLAAAGTASAETISGTITNIDPSSGRVTLRRDGNSENLEVTVRDRAALARLRSGSAVSLDANRMGSGSWESSTIQTANLESSAARSSGASLGMSAGNTLPAGGSSVGSSTGVSNGATGTSGNTSAAGASSL
jgi:Cu/Ag efflux protein CusF